MTIRRKITNSSIRELHISDSRMNDTELSGFHARISPKGKITYYLFYRFNGKQQNYKLGAHPEITPMQARDIAKLTHASVFNGIDPHVARKQFKEDEKLAKLSTLEAFLDNRYTKWYVAKQSKSDDIEIRNLKKYFPSLLPMQLRDINASLVEKLRTEMLNRELSSATINRRVTTLKSVMSRAVEWEVIEKHDLRKVKALKEDNSRVRYLSFEEEEALKRALSARDFRIKKDRENGNKHRQDRSYPLLPDLSNYTFADHLEPLIILAKNTGMRKGEILNLTWSDINFEREFVTVRAANAKSGKTRHIPLNQKVKSALLNWKLDCGQSHWVFEGENQQPLKDFKKSWLALMKKTEIIDFRFHDFRHDFASKLVMAGVDLNTVRELLGHSSIQMTLRYAHLAPEHKARAVNLI